MFISFEIKFRLMMNFERLYTSAVKNVSSSNIHSKVKLTTDVKVQRQKNQLYTISPLGFSGYLPHVKMFQYKNVFDDNTFQTVAVPLVKRVSDVVSYVCGKDAVKVSQDGHTFTIDKDVPVKEIYGLPSVSFEIPGSPQSNDFLTVHVDLSYNGNIVGKGSYTPGDSSVVLKHVTTFQLQNGLSSVEVHLMHGDHSEITSNMYLNTGNFFFNCKMCICVEHLMVQ